jgi:hypothetical protein
MYKNEVLPRIYEELGARPSPYEEADTQTREHTRIYQKCLNEFFPPKKYIIDSAEPLFKYVRNLYLFSFDDTLITLTIRRIKRSQSGDLTSDASHGTLSTKILRSRFHRTQTVSPGPKLTSEVVQSHRPLSGRSTIMNARKE